MTSSSEPESKPLLHWLRMVEAVMNMLDRDLEELMAAQDATVMG